MISLFSNRTEAVGHDWLDEHAEQWVEHGLITSDQVDAIRDFEQHEAPEPRLSIVAELAVYLGSVLALMSGAMMVGPNWEALRTVASGILPMSAAAAHARSRGGTNTGTGCSTGTRVRTA